MVCLREGCEVKSRGRILRLFRQVCPLTPGADAAIPPARLSSRSKMRAYVWLGGALIWALPPFFICTRLSL